MSSKQNTQLTDVATYDVKNIVFSDPVSGEIPDSKPKIEFKRINISTLNPDGTEGELILPTENLYSFGVCENRSMETNKVNGYTFPICLWNKNGPTETETQWTDKFNEIIDTCIDHIVDVKDDIEMYELTRSDLTKSKGGINPLYWKKERVKNEKTGKMELQNVPGRGPTLYAKLMYSKAKNIFMSLFYDTEGNNLEPLNLIGQHCFFRGAVKIDSIFIGSKISIQVKIYEAEVEPVTNGPKRLLSRPKVVPKVVVESKQPEEKENETEIKDSDSESEEETPPPKKLIKKVVRKVKK